MLTTGGGGRPDFERSQQEALAHHIVDILSQKGPFTEFAEQDNGKGGKKKEEVFFPAPAALDWPFKSDDYTHHLYQERTTKQLREAGLAVPRPKMIKILKQGIFYRRGPVKDPRLLVKSGGAGAYSTLSAAAAVVSKAADEITAEATKHFGGYFAMGVVRAGGYFGLIDAEHKLAKQVEQHNDFLVGRLNVLF